MPNRPNDRKHWDRQRHQHGVFNVNVKTTPANPPSQNTQPQQAQQNANSIENQKIPSNAQPVSTDSATDNINPHSLFTFIERPTSPTTESAPKPPQATGMGCVIS